MKKFRDKEWINVEFRHIDKPEGEIYEWVELVKSSFPELKEGERIFIDYSWGYDDSIEFEAIRSREETDEEYATAKEKWEIKQSILKKAAEKRKKTLTSKKSIKESEEKKLYEKLKKKYES
jgi:hypothetical protein